MCTINSTHELQTLQLEVIFEIGQTKSGYKCVLHPATNTCRFTLMSPTQHNANHSLMEKRRRFSSLFCLDDGKPENRNSWQANLFLSSNFKQQRCEADVLTGSSAPPFSLFEIRNAARPNLQMTFFTFSADYVNGNTCL